ncbi:MAG: hypothetical protein JW788_03190, partial [Candidatus Omnitrophica bacterium]|nr:hypothetical protein [Candidatus Omnitrophota bacterium]
EFKKMYARYGINYETPVFDFKDPQVDYFAKYNFAVQESQDSVSPRNNPTTGDILFDLGIFPQRNLKGTSEDHRMQGRCLQLILFNIFATWYYLPYRSLEEYKKVASGFIREKIAYFLPLVDEYAKKRASDRLAILL